MSGCLVAGESKAIASPVALARFRAWDELPNVEAVACSDEYLVYLR